MKTRGSLAALIIMGALTVLWLVDSGSDSGDLSIRATEGSGSQVTSDGSVPTQDDDREAMDDFEIALGGEAAPEQLALQDELVAEEWPDGEVADQVQASTSTIIVGSTTTSEPAASPTTTAATSTSTTGAIVPSSAVEPSAGSSTSLAGHGTDNGAQQGATNSATPVVDSDETIVIREVAQALIVTENPKPAGDDLDLAAVAPTTPSSGSQAPAVTTKAPGKTPATKAPGKTPATKAPGKTPATKAPGKTPTTKGPGKTPTTKGPGKTPTTKALSKTPATKAPGKTPTTKAPGKTPTTKAPGKTPATKAPGKTPTTKALSKTPTTKAPAVSLPSGDYGSNLKLIKAASVRNRNHDNSPYRHTPSASLTPSNHYGPRSDYLNNPAGNPEQAFPVPNGGQFRTACEFSHFSYDDPLVYPGKPGASHLHMNFGNTDVNAYSTADSLLNSGSSTCNGQELNRTGYWVPAMFDGKGNVRIPERIVVYYKGEGLARGKAEVYPAGAAMVMNTNLNSVDNGSGGAAGKFSFVCANNYSANGGQQSNVIPNCDGSKFKKLYGADDPRMVLEMNVKFPQCWNGRDPSNPGNFRHPQNGSWYYSLCENDFSHTLPNLEYFVNYVVEQGENTNDWYLASDVAPTQFGTSKADGGSSIHGDWWGAWHRQTNQMWIDNCVNYKTGAASGCGMGYLTDGGPNGSAPYDGPALKYRPQYTGPNKVPAKTLFGELCPNPDRRYSQPEDAAFCRPSSR